MFRRSGLQIYSRELKHIYDQTYTYIRKGLHVYTLKAKRMVAYNSPSAVMRHPLLYCYSSTFFASLLVVEEVNKFIYCVDAYFPVNVVLMVLYRTKTDI